MKPIALEGSTPPDGQYLYRYVDYFDMYSRPAYRLEKYLIAKETPCGYWIITGRYTNRRKWVPKVARNAYAKTTPEAALEAYWFRKKRHVTILDSQLYWAKTRLERVEKELGK